MTKRLLIIAIAFIASLTTMYAQEVNFDESLVAPYTLPDPLRFVDGRKVKKSGGCCHDWQPAGPMTCHTMKKYLTTLYTGFASVSRNPRLRLSSVC